jgi:hypothetical protein
MYTRSILSPYIGQTPPPKIGAELPNIITIANKTKAGTTTTGGKLKISRKDSMFGDNENPWISFLQTYGNKGYTMPELRARYHDMRIGLEGGRRQMYGGSQLAIGEMNSYAGPRNLARGGNSYRTRQISGNWSTLPRNVVNDISGLAPLTAKVGGRMRGKGRYNEEDFSEWLNEAQNWRKEHGGPPINYSQERRKWKQWQLEHEG